MGMELPLFCFLAQRSHVFFNQCFEGDLTLGLETVAAVTWMCLFCPISRSLRIRCVLIKKTSCLSSEWKWDAFPFSVFKFYWGFSALNAMMMSIL